MTYQEEKEKILRSISDDRISSATLAEASLLLDELVKKMVIGEDETDYKDGTPEYLFYASRNGLRASQRQVMEKEES